MFAAVSGLAMSSALAQAPPAPAPAPTLAPPPAAASVNPGSVPIINTQAKDEWLASKLKGMTVVGSDDQKIGSVVDILFDKTGQAKAFIVGVGGLLGLGAKQVAVELTAFREVPAADGQVTDRARDGQLSSMAFAPKAIASAKDPSVR